MALVPGVSKDFIRPARQQFSRQTAMRVQVDENTVSRAELR